MLLEAFRVLEENRPPEGYGPGGLKAWPSEVAEWFQRRQASSRTAGRGVREAEVEKLAEQLFNADLGDLELGIEIDWDSRKQQMDFYGVAQDTSVGIWPVGHFLTIQWDYKPQKEGFRPVKFKWGKGDLDRDERQDIVRAVKKNAQRLGDKIQLAEMY